MFGVVCENVRQINKLGYHIVENSIDGFSTMTKIISTEGEEVAKISLYGREFALLKVVANGERVKKIKFVTIYTTTGVLPRQKSILLELIKTNGKKIWCEIPFKEGLSTFWG